MVALNSTDTIFAAAVKPVQKGTLLPITVRENSVHNWFLGITKEVTEGSVQNEFAVTDHGGFIEFELPKGTAQFAEMIVHDEDGKQIWKTQSFNTRVIRWDKQTAIGEKVPKGMYCFQVRQGGHHVDGVAMVA